VQLTGRDAGKEAVRRAAPKARYVHLATHGFFAPPVSATQADPSAKLLDGPRFVGLEMRTPPILPALVGRNPLVLSGLVLAGANAPAAEGILTAEEIVDLDLAGTELVVLSACETGLGKVAGGEGVYSLQRAFALAGARTTITSLWQVDDTATQALMVEFYRNLWVRKQGKLEALRQAQLALLRGRLNVPPGGGQRVTPYLWAAFVLGGDWR